MLRRLVFCLCIAAIAASACPASAALVIGSMEVQSIAAQSINIPGDSPLVGLGVVPGDYDIDALGSFTATWDAENAGTAKVSAFTASYSGANGPFGPYTLTATGDPGSFTGELTNILSDGAGQLISATLTVNTTFAFVTPGITAFTQLPGRFAGELTPGGSLGSVFSDPSRPNDALDVFANLGSPFDPVKLATSSNRTVTAVPEPSGLGLVLLVSCLPMWRRSR